MSILPLIITIYNDNEFIVKYLIEHDVRADANKAYDYYSCFDNSHSSYTPLCIACHKENETNVKYLIDHGADINDNILMEAYQNGNVTIIKYLIEYGALSIAIKKRDKTLIEYLVEHTDEYFNYLIDLGYDNNDTLLNKVCENVKISSEFYIEINDIDINLNFKRIN